MEEGILEIEVAVKGFRGLVGVARSDCQSGLVLGAEAFKPRLPLCCPSIATTGVGIISLAIVG